MIKSIILGLIIVLIIIQIVDNYYPFKSKKHIELTHIALNRQDKKSYIYVDGEVKEGDLFIEFWLPTKDLDKSVFIKRTLPTIPKETEK